jgi:hypothetical protein
MAKDVYDQHAFPRLRQAIKALPDMPPEPNTARGMVHALREDFERKLAGGWTTEQLAAFMGQQGIKITPKTLGNYLKAFGVGSGPLKGPARPRRRADQASPSSPAELPPPLSVAATNLSPSVNTEWPINHPSDVREAREERPRRRTAFFNEDN